MILTIITVIEIFGNILFKRKNGIAIKIDEANSPIKRNKINPIYPKLFELVNIM
jgi:hypothetical protein